MRLSVLTAAVAGVAMIAGTAQAGILYTVRTSDDMLRAFDTNTLTFTNVGLLGTGFDFGDLAYNPNNQTMYMIPGRPTRNLYTVNLNTGAATLVGAHNQIDLFGLAWHPGRNTMYASQSTSAFGVHSINLNTGATTFIGNPGIGLDALTYDSRRGKLIGAFAGPGDLYEIDPDTGAATLVYDGSFFDNCGMAYDADTDKIWMIDWSGVIYTFDPNNNYARTTVLSGIGSHDGFAAITEIPGPAGLAILGLGLVARRNRRRTNA